MNQSDSVYRLQSFFSFVNSYLQSYRRNFGKTTGETVILNFLEGNDTIRILANVTEPAEAAKVGDFWYSGGILRKIIFVDELGVRQYKVCYKYEDAFSTTLISLNPSVTGSGTTNPNPGNPGGGNGGGIPNTTPPPTGNPILSGGGQMSGPLYLRSKIREPNEAVPKDYVDKAYARLQEQVNEVSRIAAAASSTSTQSAQTIAQANLELKEVKKFKVAKVSKTIAAKEWTVVHGAASRSLFVQIFDATGEMIMADTIRIIDENTVKMEFAVAVSGTATIFIT